VAEKRVDEHKSPGVERKSDSKMFEERLGLETTGDVYHPNFLFYTAALGFGLTQQNLSSDIISDKTDGSLNDYDVKVQMLQKKPYPAVFYTKKLQNIIPRQFLGSVRSEVQSSGVSFGLGLKDWPMRFQYNTTENKQKALASTVDDFFNRQDDQFRYSLSHDFSNLSSLSFEFERNEISQRSTGLSTDLIDNFYTLHHNLIFGQEEQHRLGSFVRYLDQTVPYDHTSLRWNEDLRLQHTPNFLTNYRFSFTDRKRGVFGSQSEFSEKTTQGKVGFEHRLFDSLITTGNIFASESEFGNGDAVRPVQKGGDLGFNYQKKNPWGMLISSYSITSLKIDQSGGSGTGYVIGESHIVPTGAAPIIELDRVNIDTISITVEDGNGVPFQNEDYTISEINGKVILNLRTVGTITPPNFSPGQEFFVSYSFFIEPEREEEILRQNFTVKERFDNGLSLYYQHHRQDETVKSTLTEIRPDEYTTNTYGIDYVKRGLALVADYSETDSTYITSTSKRIQASYSWRLNPETSATVHAFNHWLDYGEPDPREVSLFSTGGEIFSRLTNRLGISNRIDYRDEDDSRFGVTRGFQFNSELQYNNRQLSITAGIELDMLKRRESETDGYFLYLRLKRLF
jgi:hypothetical protein